MKKDIIYHIHAIDTSNWLHRAYHVVPPTSMSVDGVPTGAVKVFINMVESLLGKIRDKQADNEKHYIAFAIDCPRVRSWRYLMMLPWAEKQARKTGIPLKDLCYKGRRNTDEEKRESLRIQTKILLEMLDACGFPLIGAPDAEADDILGTISRVFHKRRNVRVHLYTRDKDAAQLLIFPNTEIVHPAIGGAAERRLSSSADCMEVYGVLPERVIDFLVMCGDKVDNLPGIPGVAEKTAIKLITEYGSLAEVMDNPKAIKSVKALREGNLPMSLDMLARMITLDCKVKEVPRKARGFKRAELTDERIKAMRKLRKRYKFNSLFGA